jgi:hypothetical protein
MKKIIIIPLILILLSIIITADPEYINHEGIDIGASYQRDGNGLWAGRTAIPYSYGANIAGTPLSYDLDSDGTNEVITIIGNEVSILHFTTSIGFNLVAAYNIGEAEMIVAREDTYDNDFYQTLGLIDYDSDNLTEIVFANSTSMGVLEYNGTSLNFVQAAHFTNVSTGTSVPAVTRPNIECATHNYWANNVGQCVMLMQHKGGLSVWVLSNYYDLNNNTIRKNIVSGNNMANGGSYSSMKIVLFDGDNDGYLNSYWSTHLNGTTAYYVFTSEIQVDNSIVSKEGYIAGNYLYIDSYGNHPSTNIIVNNLDGTLSNGAEISWLYSDGTNWYGRTIKATDGSTISSSYCTALTCPEGTAASNLWVASNTLYTPYTGDVCGYIRNPTNNDPGVNIDTVFCLSQYAGAGYTETEISNTQNFTNQIYAYEGALAGSNGFMTNQFIVQGSTKENNALNEMDRLLPVDHQKSGSLDIIGVTYGSSLKYYDDNYNNANYFISDFETPVNPTCYGYTYTFTATLTDDESDAGNCYAEESYINGTVMQNFSSATINPFSSPYEFYYVADENGQFTLNFYCKDQYHSSYVNKQFGILVKNTSPCNDPTYTQTTSYETNASLTDNNLLIDQFNDFSSNFGINSKLAKSIISLILIVLLGAVTAISLLGKQMQGNVVVFIISLETVAALIIFYWIGWMSAIPLVIIGLVCAMVIVGYFFGKTNQIGG